jgi:hypothetical protein
VFYSKLRKRVGVWLIYTRRDDCDEGKAEKSREYTNIRKLRTTGIIMQFVRTSPPIPDLGISSRRIFGVDSVPWNNAVQRFTVRVGMWFTHTLPAAYE